MALQTQHRLRGLQQAADRRTVRVMANRAVFDSRRMVENMGALHGLMASRTAIGFVARHRLRGTMRIMATGASHAALGDRVMGVHAEFSDDVLVADCAKRGRFTAFKRRRTQFVDFRLMNAVTITALHARIIMFAQREMHTPLVGFMASQTLLRARLFGKQLPGLFRRRMCLRIAMTIRAIVVIDMNLRFRFMTIDTLMSTELSSRIHRRARGSFQRRCDRRNSASP